MAKRRLDLLLVEKGLTPSREKAQALIMAGEVVMEGGHLLKPSSLVEEDAEISLKKALPYVSRGGLKLEHALRQFALKPSGMIALDVGASTGGFTDCLLQQGAKRVYALDVGYGQLDLKLRRDPRVVVMEKVNAHYPFSLPEPVNITTIDVSFISLVKVLPNILSHLVEPAWLLALVKPQFEARREQVQKGGLVRDPLVHAQVIGELACWCISQGLRIRGLTPSPILGTKGNREFFLFLEGSKV